MRLFLFVLAFVTVLTATPLVLTHVSYRVVPDGLGQRLTNRFVWVCAHVMDRCQRLLDWAERHAIQHAVNLAGTPHLHALKRHERSQRWHRLAAMLSELGARIDPQGLHVTAKALHRICWPCYERAAGWWDHEVDCGGHDCRTCEVCILMQTEAR